MTTSTIVRAGAALTAASALVLAGLMSPASAASSTAKLKGAVTIGGQPLASAKVQLYRLVYDESIQEFELGSRLKTDTTDSKGRYDFSGLKAGSPRTNRYMILATDRSGKGVKKYQLAIVTKGKTLTKNLRLQQAAALTGTINAADGRPSAGLTVSVDIPETDDLSGRAYHVLLPSGHTTVRSDGTFALTGLPAGTYDEIRVTDAGHAAQCYDIKGATLGDCRAIPWQQQFVTLKGGETRALPTVTKTTFAPAVTTLLGRVTDTSGKALKGIEVSAAPPGTGRSGTPVVTRSSGRFSLKDRFEPGTYVVVYHDPKGIYADQTAAGGTIQVTGGSTMRGLDAKLKSATKNRVSWKSGPGFIQATFSLTRRVSGGRPSGTMTITAAGLSATAPVRKGKVTVRLTGVPVSKHGHDVTAIYSGTSNTAGFTRGFSPK